MNEILAQGDLLIESVDTLPISGNTVGPGGDGVLVLAEGEATGHRHAIFDIVKDGKTHTFDSFECAISRLAPKCA